MNVFIPMLNFAFILIWISLGFYLLYTVAFKFPKTIKICSSRIKKIEKDIEDISYRIDRMQK